MFPIIAFMQEADDSFMTADQFVLTMALFQVQITTPRHTRHRYRIMDFIKCIDKTTSVFVLP